MTVTFGVEGLGLEDQDLRSGAGGGGLAQGSIEVSQNYAWSVVGVNR